MDERRKNSRLELQSKLIVHRLDEEENVDIQTEIIDLSKTGLGFTCTEPLAIGSIYESFLTIWTKENIHAFLEIVRIVKHDDGFEYGAIFIGMPEVEASRIEVYRTIEKK